MKEDQNKEKSHLEDYKSWIKEGNHHLKLKEYTAALVCYDNSLELFDTIGGLLEFLLSGKK